MNFYFLLYGLIIAIVILAAWCIYAYQYRSSVTRLCILASQKYIETLPFEISQKYLILCDENQSYYNSDTKKFTAVFTISPDSNNLNMPKLPDVVKEYTVINSDEDCNFNKIVCMEEKPDDCLNRDRKQKIISTATCINID
jgi:hypothetical protein